MERRVARRYARALFLTALQENQVQRIGQDLDLIAESVRGDEGLQNLLYSPLVPDEHKTEIIQHRFERQIEPATLRMLALLIQKDREKLFDVVREEYHALREEHEGLLRATIYSAVPLAASYRQALISTLEQKTGKTLIPTFEVEPSLIGGVRVVMGDYQIDGSVQGALERLRDTVLLEIERRRTVR